MRPSLELDTEPAWGPSFAPVPSHLQVQPRLVLTVSEPSCIAEEQDQLRNLRGQGDTEMWGPLFRMIKNSKVMTEP